MKTKHSKAAAGVIVLVIIVVALGAGVWYFTSSQNTFLDKIINPETNKETEEGQNGSNKQGAELSIAELYNQVTKHDSISCQVKASTAQGEQEVSLFIEDGNVREELTASGQKVVLLLPKTGDQYLYYPQQNMASKLVRSEEKKQKAPNPQEISNQITPQSFKVIGEETIRGKECLVVKTLLNEENENPLTTIWLGKEHALPLKMTIGSGEKIQTVEFLNYQFEDIEDSLFELPSDARIMEMPAN